MGGEGGGPWVFQKRLRKTVVRGPAVGTAHVERGNGEGGHRAVGVSDRRDVVRKVERPCLEARLAHLRALPAQPVRVSKSSR